MASPRADARTPGTPEAAHRSFRSTDERLAEQAAAAPSARDLRRARQLQARRQEILAAAEELFTAHGYDGAGLDQIADRSGHSVGAIYRVFASKDDVYAAVLERHARSLAADLLRCTDSSGSGLTMLLDMASTAVRRLREFPDHARAPLGSPAPPPAATGRQSTTGAMLDAYATAIRQGQLDGSVRTGDPRDLAKYLGGLVFAHMHVDPEIVGRPGGMSLEGFLGLVRAALSAG